MALWLLVQKEAITAATQGRQTPDRNPAVDYLSPEESDQCLGQQRGRNLRKQCVADAVHTYPESTPAWERLRSELLLKKQFMGGSH